MFDVCVSGFICFSYFTCRDTAKRHVRSNGHGGCGLQGALACCTEGANNAANALASWGASVGDNDAKVIKCSQFAQHCRLCRVHPSLKSLRSRHATCNRSSPSSSPRMEEQIQHCVSCCTVDIIAKQFPHCQCSSSSGQLAVHVRHVFISSIQLDKMRSLSCQWQQPTTSKLKLPNMSSINDITHNLMYSPS